MATVTGGGSAMSNAGQGTRGLSAGDWTRIQRLRGAKPYGQVVGSNINTDNNIGATQFLKNSDISPPEPGQIPYGQALLIPYAAAGTPKTLRPASNWTDYVASQHVDFYTSSQNVGADGSGQPGAVLSLTQLANGKSDNGSGWKGKPAISAVNAFNRLKILS